MADTLCQFFTWAVRDVIFFSGDVQTTTIAVAITSSLCCSIVVAMVHVMALFLPEKTKEKPGRRYYRSNSTGTNSSKKIPSDWLRSGQIRVPCVKCGRYFADIGCRFVTCKNCCFCVLSCQIHQKTSLCSTPCSNKQTEMDLSSAGMVSCPERLGFVGAQLTCLNLAENQLTELPQEISCLRGLQKLSVKSNKLHSLPTTLGALSQLSMLDISNNVLSEIPNSLKLEESEICHLVTEIKCVTSLVSLQELHLSHNVVQTVPVDIAQLTEIQMLDVSHNRIEEICDALFSLFQLKILCLQSNPIKNIPLSVGNLIQLESLDLGSCDITSLPVTIGNCSKLNSLKLEHNKLTRVPYQIGQLYRLQHLSLENNSLTHLPAVMSFLPDKVRITVQGNPLVKQEHYCSYEVLLAPESFPSLKELTARNIVQHNIPQIKTLPQVLQDMISTPEKCSRCGGPFFQFYRGQMEGSTFVFSDTEVIPLYNQCCSPHQPQGCG